MRNTTYQMQTIPGLRQISRLPEPKGIREQKIIRCDVVFGSPSLGCRGTGVCKITAHRTVRQDGWRRDCNGTTAFLSAINGGFGVSLFLLRELMCVNILRHHLRHQQLEIKEPCDIPPAFAASLGLHIPALPPGTYPVTEQNGYFRIDIG